MGLDELLRVLREEAANEERALREEAGREAERVLVEARAESSRLREVALARADAAGAARLRAVRESAALERERTLLAAGRKQLDRLRAEALARLPAEVSAADVERLVGELSAEAGPIVSYVLVDPGFGDAARRALARRGDGSAPEIREAPTPRGGVSLVSGALELDDTVAARLERAWPRLEPELARLLLEEP